MNKFYLLIAMLLTGMLCLTGCGGGDGDGDAESTAAAPADTTSSSDSSDPADTVVGELPPVEVVAGAAVDFSAITPTGLRQTGKSIISGRGTVFDVACDPIEGAELYYFVPSFPADHFASRVPSATYQTTVAQGSEPYTLKVFGAKVEPWASTKQAQAILN